MSGLDGAAAAFAEDMGVSSKGSDDGGSAPVMTEADVFPHLGGHDDDAGIAGGDDEAPKRRTRSQQPEGLDDEDDEELEIPSEDDDSDAGDEDDEGDDPDAGDEDDEDDDPSAEGEVYEVMIDGQPAQVDLKEALNGYVRSETFYRRLNKLNEFETAINGRAREVHDLQVAYVEKTKELEALIDSLVPAEPDWDKVYAENPGKARELQKNYEALSGKRAEIKANRDKAIADARAEAETNFKKWKRDQNNRLAELFPTWTDPEKGVDNMTRDTAMMAETAKAAGFTDEDIENTHDARMINILWKAARYDRIMSRKAPVPVNKGKRPVSQGAGRTRTAPKGKARNNATRLSRTGKLEDATAVFQDIISPRR